MRGTMHEDVVLHFECLVTKQMLQDRLACKVKKWRFKLNILTEKTFKNIVRYKNLPIA